MEYYAHPNEKLINHLNMVKVLSSEYGRNIKSEKVTAMLGMLHDIGKHTKKFQDVLSGKQSHIDHAIVAGEVLYRLMQDGEFECDDSRIANIMLHIVAGHHSEFYGGYNDQKQYIDLDDMYDTPIDYDYAPTRDRNKTNALSSDEEFAEILSYVRKEKLCFNIEKGDYLDIDEMNEAATMLYARILFSCLIDADYTATGFACNNPEYNESDIKKITADLLVENELDAEICLNKLNNYRDELVAKSEHSGINELRNKVYLDAEAAGKTFNPGLYRMSAPTGMGKTLSLIKFALEQAAKNGQKRVIVVLPFLSIIQQNTDEYKKIFGQNVVIESDSMTELTDEQRELAARWDAPIVVTTSVAFFQTLFSANAPTLRKLHRVADSVVVFDESQSLGFKYTSVTMRTLEALSQFFNTTVLLSTATQPVYNYRKDLNVDIKEVIKDVDWLYRKYGQFKKTEVEFDLSMEGYSCRVLAEKYKNDDEVLYVVNTTKKAKELYVAVKEYHDLDSVFLLSSRLCPDHKRKVLLEVRNRLGKHLPCHLVSTQCIEAGVDVDFPKGFREYAPLVSVIQTMGRVNRNGKTRGYVLISNFMDDSCPDDYYRNEKNLTYNIALGLEGKVDVNALEIIDTYYKKLYSGIEGSDEGYNDGKRDKNGSISSAEYKEDIYEMYKGYHLIDDAEQYNVIVPYDSNKHSFETYCTKYQNNGYIMSEKDIKEMHDICVSIIGNGKSGKFIDRHCHRLSVKNSSSIIPTNWFIADIDDIYDTKIGLIDSENDEEGLLL